jgi:RNA polymerase sigma-70 factor (ECF subfamily)
MYRELPGLESEAHLRFWLRRVAANRCIDRLRQMKRVELEPLDAVAELADTEAVDDPLLRRHLEALIAELAPAARAVLLLRYQEDLEPLEIARTLEMPVNTVKSHLKRALSTLRARLAGLKLVESSGERNA